MKTRSVIESRIKANTAETVYSDITNIETQTLRKFFRFTNTEKFTTWAVNRVAENDYSLTQPLSPSQRLQVHFENTTLEWMLKD